MKALLITVAAVSLYLQVINALPNLLEPRIFFQTSGSSSSSADVEGSSKKTVVVSSEDGEETTTTTVIKSRSLAGGGSGAAGVIGGGSGAFGGGGSGAFGGGGSGAFGGGGSGAFGGGGSGAFGGGGSGAAGGGSGAAAGGGSGAAGAISVAPGGGSGVVVGREGRVNLGKPEPRTFFQTSGSSSSSADVEGSSKKTVVVSSEDGEETTTTTVIKSRSILDGVGGTIGGLVGGGSGATGVVGGERNGEFCNSEKCQTKDGDCDCSKCKHHLYDADGKFEYAVTVTSNCTQVSNCDVQLKKLVDEYNRKVTLLNSANTDISLITIEKNQVSIELKKCSSKYNAISNDYEEITTEVTVVKKKLQAALDDYAKLNAKWIAASAEAQKWKTKWESQEINWKKALDDNARLTKTLNEYSTTINNLQFTIKETTIKNNKCAGETDEWKRKWEVENAKVIKRERTISEWEASNSDLKERINKQTIDLTSCRNRNQQNDIEINKFKNSDAEWQKRFSSCTVDLGKCDVSLKRATIDFDADQLAHLNEKKRYETLQIDLVECNNGRKRIEENVQSERTNVAQCKKEIVAIREDCSKRYQKYEDDLANFKLNSKASIDQCELSLKLERVNITNITIDITKLKNQIVDIDSKLTSCRKTSDECDKKSKLCDDDSITSKRTIETLRINLADTNKNVTACQHNTNVLLFQLAERKSNLDSCTADLDKTKTKLDNADTIIVDLNKKISHFDDANKKCQTDLAILRCDVDGHLAGVRSAEQKVYVALQQALTILDGNTKASNDFVGSRNIFCRAS